MATFYGTTVNGGAGSAGVVFKLDTTGTLTVLHNFTAGTSDGASPSSGLVHDSAGNLYGTTLGGGASNSGIVFKITPTGAEKVLYNFTGGADGRYPEAGLFRDPKGNLYGVTQNGGDVTGVCASMGCGTIYELTLP
jgi:uncharacterized repeat protein (TIGR03803 family)